jgi:hypothetical protein
LFLYNFYFNYPWLHGKLLLWIESGRINDTGL